MSHSHGPRRGLVEVVDVEDAGALGRAVHAEVADVGVTEDVDLEAGRVLAQRAEVRGHHAGGAAVEGERAAVGHDLLAPQHEPLVATLRGLVDDVQRVAIVGRGPVRQPVETHGRR